MDEIKLRRAYPLGFHGLDGEFAHFPRDFRDLSAALVHFASPSLFSCSINHLDDSTTNFRCQEKIPRQPQLSREIRFCSDGEIQRILTVTDQFFERYRVNVLVDGVVQTAPEIERVHSSARGQSIGSCSRQATGASEPSVMRRMSPTVYSEG